MVGCYIGVMIKFFRDVVGVFLMLCGSVVVIGVFDGFYCGY